MTVDVVRHSGALVVTALVDDSEDRFYQSMTFYGYEDGEVPVLFVAAMKERGYRIVTD